MSDTDETIDAEVKHSIYTLADKCDVGASPDSTESPGARLLTRIQDAANEADAAVLLEGIREFVDSGEDADDYTVNDLPDTLRDSIHEWADSAVQIYTYQAWQEFTDLALWQEDLSELGEVSGEDLTRDVAQRAAYLVANRGIGILLAERAVLLHQANPVTRCETCEDVIPAGEGVENLRSIYCDTTCIPEPEPDDMSGSRHNGDR